MIYDLENPLHRKQYKLYVNKLFNEKKKVEVVDKSVRTLSQNSYLHVLCRILAIETGVTEKYAKEEYFKRQANPDMFVQSVVDPITGESREVLADSSELSVADMSIAIDKFRTWSEQQGIYLPEAHLKGEDTDYVEFTDEEDKKAFEQAIVETGRLEKYL